MVIQCVLITTWSNRLIKNKNANARQTWGNILHNERSLSILTDISLYVHNIFDSTTKDYKHYVDKINNTISELNVYSDIYIANKVIGLFEDILDEFKFCTNVDDFKFKIFTELAYIHHDLTQKFD